MIQKVAYSKIKLYTPVFSLDRFLHGAIQTWQQDIELPSLVQAEELKINKIYAVINLVI